ncbi:hypothetical protein Sango_2746100 [Sesamum angolense]|uniref:SWIM-type domain-containing protein n=1 Tax=Sesamum angolense TaxID=2727404 RepID=A0AAE1W120_9LAMI|nr:hypothetical protein Sango_2746100 [Sesamum angolense]
MSLRNLQLVDFPNPKYDKYGLERFVTIILYHGGEVKHSPIAEFVGGNQSKFDFVDVEDMCISYLNGLGEKLGYMEPKKFYREFTLYLEANSDEPATQIGSSNPIVVVGDEKGKGVAIEGGGVIQVDLQSEGEGSGHSEGVGEGDSLHESEYGPEDEEDGENKDEEGVQKGEQESSESDNSSDSDFFVSEDDFDSEESFRIDPNRNVKGFRKDIIKDIRCHVSKHQAYRVKRKALNAIEGRVEDQFDQLWDYAAELRASNPRSTVIMAMTKRDDGTDRGKFEKLYVCFDALRQGFLHGCRPFIGVDGCHLKGPHGGILLTAVSIDPNNNLYHLAYVVVLEETRESCQWFLELLKGDLNVQHTCTCRKWDLTGIPCNHGMSAICSQSLEPEDFVNPCYSIETFLEVYKHAILPVNGPQLWTKTGHNQKGCERKKIDNPTTSQDANSNDQTTTSKLTARKKTIPPQIKQKEAAHSQRQSKKRKGVEVQATHTTSSANVPSRRITWSTPLLAATEPNQATTTGPNFKALFYPHQTSGNSKECKWNAKLIRSGGFLREENVSQLRTKTFIYRGDVSLGWESTWSPISRRTDMGGWVRLPPNLILYRCAYHASSRWGRESLSSRALWMFLDVLGVLLLKGVWAGGSSPYGSWERGAALCSLLEILNEDSYDGRSLIDEHFGLSPKVEPLGHSLANIMFGKLLHSQAGGSCEFKSYR